jgi:hypothetical protein
MTENLISDTSQPVSPPVSPAREMWRALTKAHKSWRGIFRLYGFGMLFGALGAIPAFLLWQAGITGEHTLVAPVIIGSILYSSWKTRNDE